MDTPPFSELNLPDTLLKAVEGLGYERPSQIQALTIPVAMEGHDLVGLSQTGSGKTAAFVLPMLAKLDFDAPGPQGIILCPTRELAVQVCEEVYRLGAHIDGLRAVPIYGGAPMDRQIRLLDRGAHLVVGTPGRLLDHMRRGTLKLGAVRMIVLDEADRMLDMGFREEMEEILKQMPKERQALFFSATMNRYVEKLIDAFGNAPRRISVDQKSKTVSTIDQCYYEVRIRSKIEVLSRLLDLESPKLAIVFCNTKRMVDECTEALLARGYAADRLHGDITQQMRERVIKRFRDGVVELLVATDVAGRGLDVDDVDVVFNYDLPQDPEDYVHRIGRTGRAGKSGKAVSFVFGREVYRLQNVERYTRQVIRRERIPSQEQVEGKRADELFETIKDRLEAGTFEAQEEYIDRLLEQGHTPTDIAGALFTLLRESIAREGEEIHEDREPAKRDRPERTAPRERVEEREPRREGGPPPRQQQREHPREPEGRAPRGQDRFEERGSERAPFKRKTGPDAGMASLFINIGKDEGIIPGEIAGMLYREAGIPDGSVGRISLFKRHTLVDVREDIAEEILRNVGRAKLKGRPVRLKLDDGGRQKN